MRFAIMETVVTPGGHEIDFDRLFGGANLVNKMGQEALSEYRSQGEQTTNATKYKRYDDEVLNARLRNPQIEGNVLLVDIDNVPRLVTLPQTVVDAYKEGALPINAIANRILAKTDQFTETNQREVLNVSEQYEQNKEREQVRAAGLDIKDVLSEIVENQF